MNLTEWSCKRCHATGSVELMPITGLSLDAVIATTLFAAHHKESPECLPFDGLTVLVPVAPMKAERRGFVTGWSQ